jgi:hypothetical protein
MSFDWNNALKNEIGAALGMIPEVGGLLSALVSILWPQSQEDIWGEIKAQVEQLVDQQIAAEVYQQVQEDLQGLQNVMGRYQQALGTNDLEDIVTEWDNADDAFLNALPHFQEQQYQVQLLPLFAQFANLHLSLLRDGVQFGESWGWNSATQKSHSANLSNAIASYSTWAEKIYTMELLPISAYNAGKDPQGTQHKIEPFRSMNQYIRQMTLTVLDFQQTWKYFDPSVYPNPVKVYLDREIYSDPYGTADNSGQDRIDSVQVTYPAGGGPNGETTTPRMGSQNGGTSNPPRGGIFSNVGANPVVSAVVGSGDIVNFLSFTFQDGTTTGRLGGGYPGGNANPVAFTGQILSSIYISGISDHYQSADCIVLGFKYPQDQSTAIKAAYKTQYVTSPKERTTAELAAAAVAYPVPEADLSAAAASEDWDGLRSQYQAFLKSKQG